MPETSARSVLVFEGTRFEALQHGVPPNDCSWKVAPGQLSRPGRLARGPSASVALVRQLDWERPGTTHHLVLLPPSRVVAPGEEADLSAPALLVIGEAALDITPADTLVPAAVPADIPVSSFRLRELELALDTPSVLDVYTAAPAAGPFRVPAEDADVTPPELATVAARLLDQAFRAHCFFPVLEAEHDPRLALAYQRPDGTTRVIVGATHPELFVRDLTGWLTTARRDTRPSDLPRPAARRPSSPPLSTGARVRFGTIETQSPAFAAVLERIAHVAATDLGILLLGESGTGKEHLARALHAASPRARAPFVAVNCSALSDNLIESELFGHKKGAFTGAHTDRPGAFVTAQGGTLLLDEIGDAPLRVQLALLRALETKTIRPVGSDLDRAIDVRVLAATSRNVQDLIERQVFRQDLYYRLAELTVELPPLRERREDVPGLAAQILQTLGETVKISRQAEAALMEYAWPGNVRELRNALKRAVAMRRGAEVLQVVHFAPLGEGDAGGVTETGGEFTADTLGGATWPPPGVAVAAAEAKARAFPVHVVQRADEIWRAGALPEDGPGNRHDQRALNRAALICLAERGPLSAWPSALTREWYRLFGERWATSEDGRGFRAVMRQLGVDPKSEVDGARVLGMVGKAGRAGRM